jgi:hypothetical protein
MGGFQLVFAVLALEGAFFNLTIPLTTLPLSPNKFFS